MEGSAHLFDDGIQESEVIEVVVIPIEEKLHHKPSLLKVCSESCSIYRVPPALSKYNKQEYEPQIISIGPLHHGKPHLKAMEEHKWLYLQRLMYRIPYRSIESYIALIKPLVKSAWEYYSVTIDISEEAFAEMMVIDGCFMIEYLRYNAHVLPRPLDDPVWHTSWIGFPLVRDMLMLENQLPFFILQSLFDHTNMQGYDVRSLTDLALDFVSWLEPSQKEETPLEKETPKILHLLHLLQSSLVPAPAPHDESKSGLHSSPCCCGWKKQIEQNRERMPCVTELRSAGVKFVRGEGQLNILSIKFDNGKLSIPPITLKNNTRSLLLNLIAFEQCYFWSSGHITAYAVFMDDLINSSRDVEYLRNNGFIENDMGSDEDVANLFNNLPKGTSLDFKKGDFYLRPMYVKVIAYCGTNCNVWRAALKQNYFNNPWATLSLLAAIVLLILTFSQTFFSFMSYFRPPH